MSDFQNFLDQNLSKVDFQADEAENSLVPEYDIYKEIRDMVINLRDEVDMTQKELAQRSGLTQANISNIEKGVSRPTIETLRKIADATGKRLVIEFGEREVML